jgi:group II intron reverse transcriptase/maturase
MDIVARLQDPDVLRAAWQEVAVRRGAPGIDRVTVGAFVTDLDANLERLSREIGDGSYRCLPVLRVRTSFLAASDRPLVVPAVRDRVVQRAISDQLTPVVEPLLSPACRAYRKGHSAGRAAQDVDGWVRQSTPWVLRADIRGYFDHIRPELLLGRLEPLVDAHSLRFLGRLLRQRIFDHDQVTELVVGIPQGSPLSPLLGNLYLVEFDRAVQQNHPRYIRYCDDLIVVAATEAEVQTAHAEIQKLLQPLGLELKAEKTRICRAEDGFTFLGFHFGAGGRGPATKAVDALQSRLADLARAEALEGEDVDALYRGWTAYFGSDPTFWSRTPIGILALLRAHAGSDGAGERIEARMAAPGPVSRTAALLLAEAWCAAGEPSQAWFELLDATSTELDAATLARWAAVLELQTHDLQRVLRGLGAEDRSARAGAAAERLAELGHFGPASHVANLANRIGSVAPEAVEPEQSGTEDTLDAELLDEWFQGREGVHARQAVDGSGRRRYRAVRRPIRPEDWRAHLTGEANLALPLIRAGNSVLLGVIDVDLERRLLIEQPAAHSELLGRALGVALRIRRELAEHQMDALFEFSGYKGYHLWLRFEEPVPAARARRWLLDLAASVEPLPEGVRIEVFPNRDRLRTDQVGPIVKLPLGVHARTGARCVLLDASGSEHPEPFEALRAVRRIRLPLIPSEEQEEPRPAAESPPPAPRFGSKAQRMLERCAVLGWLERKASNTAYLNHRERTTLLCTLGHLGDEGRDALHEIIGRTYNYDRQVTDRHVDRLLSCPISCPKIREIHREAVAMRACSCPIRVKDGMYPTPVLLALSPKQIPAFQERKAMAAKTAAKKKSPPSPVAVAAKPQHTATKEVPSMAAAPSPPAAAPAAAQAEPIAQSAAVAKSGAGSRIGAGSHGPVVEAEEVLQKLMDLKRQLRGIEVALEQAYAELDRLFTREGSDSLEVSAGTLQRLSGEDGTGRQFILRI